MAGAAGAVSIDALIGGIARRLTHHVMTLPVVEDGTTLPSPDAGSALLLYLHVPFCTVLCPFCSFHRVQFDQHAASGYFDCLDREIALATAAGYRFDELYVGGGTPTVLPDRLCTTVARVREQHALSGVSVETNPNHLHRELLEPLREAGVTRLSVGVQSFDDTLLKEMQRYDSYGSSTDIQRRLTAVDGFFDTLNVDMIFNLPHQTDASLKRDLQILVDELGADQVSFYPLMADDGVRRNIRATMGKPDPSREKAFYETIAGTMLASGYRRTSSWCFSKKPGLFDEYIAERDDYLGLGSGAFSYLDGTMYASTFSLPRYVALTEAGKTGTVRARRMAEQDQMRYYLLMKLFTGSLDFKAAETRFSGRFRRRLWLEITALEAVGAVTHDGECLELTESGRYVWVVLMREFFTALNSLRTEMRSESATGPNPLGNPR